MPPARVIVALSLAAVFAAFVAGAAQSALPQQLGVVDLLDEANIRFDGSATGEGVGPVSSAGDVNGDGRADVLIGAPSASSGCTLCGSAYVVFGAPSATQIDLGNLGSSGFRIDGDADNDVAGDVVSSGDVNGDGKSDLILGAGNAGYNMRTHSGSVYVVFGKATTDIVDLGDPLGNKWIRIDGAAAEDFVGASVGAGNVNGDQFADVIVGALGADDAGAAYVVLGKSVPTNVDLLSLGTQGFKIAGADAGDEAGFAVSGVGDMNGDGRGEVLVGARMFNGQQGAAYVVFGKTTIDLVDLAALGTGWFRIDGAEDDDRAGSAVSGVGDMNGDGLADVIVGVPEHQAGNGAAYVVFGKNTADPVDLGVLGPGGFLIDGAANNTFAGDAVSGAGDVNGDSLPDVLVGVPFAANNDRLDSGSTYVVYGKNSPTAVDLDTLGTGGFRIDGAAAGDRAGSHVSGAGDVNGDARPDVLVGAPFEGADDSGSAYVVFGFGQPQVAYSALSGTVGQAIAPHGPTLVQRTGTPSFGIAPALPAGLALDASTGVVSGTPTAAQAQTTHTVTMTDLAGQTTALLVVTIAAAPTPPAPQPPEPPQPSPPRPVDRTAPGLNLFVTSPQRALRQKRIVVRASCNEPCRLRAEGGIVFRGISALINLRTASSNRVTKSKRALTLVLTKAAQRRLARYLNSGRRAKAIVSVRARDVAGNARSRSRGIVVRR